MDTEAHAAILAADDVAEARNSERQALRALRNPGGSPLWTRAAARRLDAEMHWTRAIEALLMWAAE